ncbi:MAG: alanine--tRNA ligase-related protein, partial [Planctomycetota bacterium]
SCSALVAVATTTFLPASTARFGESFIRTLDRGINLFQDAADRSRAAGLTAIRGEDAFQLHDTFGLYIDITEQMAAEAGLTVDRERFEALLKEAKDKSRQGSKKFAVSAITGELPPTDDAQKYKGLAGKGKILAWMKDNLVGASGKLGAGDQVALVLDKTCFYAEQGGQIGDAGWIKTKTGTFEVTDTQRLGDAVLHVGKVFEGTIKIGQPATLEVNGARLDTMRNHTATHLLNWALRKVLGEHIDQKGSLVDAQKTRFDFSHNEPLTTEQIVAVEKLVNEKIQADLPVAAITMPLEEAKQVAGVRAVFGEKYPDPVRVLLVGAKKPGEATLDSSVEFCGGTHLSQTGQAGFFKIIGQELVAKGVRRLVAVTGTEAVHTVQRLAGFVDDLAAKFRCRPEEIAGRIESLQDEVKKLQQQLKKGAATDLAGAGDKLFAEATKAGEVHVLVGEFPAAPDEQIRNQIDRLKQKAGSSVIVIGWKDEGKVGLLASVTDDLFAKIKAGDLIKQIAPLVGGGGGGRPNLAQAGGKIPEKLTEALGAAKTLIAEKLATQVA